LPIDDFIADWRLGISLTIGDWNLESWRVPGAAAGIPIGNRHSESAIPIGNRQYQSAIANRQSVNRQSAIASRQ
jgi:hypothetical protein